MAMLLVPTVFTQVDAQVVDDIVTSDQMAEIVGDYKESNTVQNSDGSFTMITHNPYVLDFNGNWTPYLVEETSDIVKVEVDAVKLIFDKNNGAVTLFENNTPSTDVLIQSDSYVVRTALLDSDVWNNLTVNDSPVTTTVVESDGSVTVSFIRENDEGKFTTEYVIDEFEVKTTVYFTNYIYDNNKFAFTQTLDLPSSIITLNVLDETLEQLEDIDLTNFVGQSFNREVLEENHDLIIQIKELRYNSGLGFENLWSVNVLSPTKVALDYANVEQSQTAIGETVELDPTFTSGGSAYDQRAHGCLAGPFTSQSGYLMAKQDSANECVRSGATFSTTGIPDGATITDVDMTMTYVFKQFNARTMKFTEQTTQPSGGTSNAKFLSYGSGTTYFTTAMSSGTQTFDLGTSADAKLQSLLTSNWFAVSTRLVTETSSCSNTGCSGGQGYNNLSITVTYTLPLPEVPTSLSIDTQDVVNELTVRWVAPTSGATPDGYKIGRSVDGGTWNDSYVADTGSTAITYDNSGLDPDTSYAYRVWSLDGSTVSTSYASVAGTTTWSVSTAPQSLSIDTQDVANEITLNWSAPSSNGGSSVTGYKIYLGGSLIDTLGNVLTYDDTISGAEIDASLTYTVKAINGVGDSVASSSATVTSWGVPSQVGTVTGTAGSSPSLSWSAPSSEATITNYKIYRAGSLHDTIGASTTYSDSTSISSGTTYAYTVSAISGVGEGSQSASVNVVAGVPPDPPTSISATIPNTATAPLAVTVSFSPSATVGTGTLTGFQLLRDGVAVATGGLVTSLSDTAPAGGTAYAYTVIALGTHGNSVASASSSVTTPDFPSAPTLTVEPKSASRIDLTWNTPADNNSLISGYKVQISTNGGVSYTDVLTGNVNTVYQALSLSGNTQHHFKVSAINGLGTGTASNVANTYTMTPTPATLTATAVSEVQINLVWGESTGSTGYKIEYESPTGNGFTVHTADTGTTDLTKSITSLTTATEYNFRVSGINAGGASVASPEASSYTWGILSAPTLDTITRMSPTSLKLDFTAGTGLPVASGYKIERQTGSGWIALVLDTANSNVTFTDTLLSSDESASYRIYAINSIGTSPVSNEKTSDVITSSGGGGGGSSSRAVSSQTGISKLIDLTFIDQIHRVILGEFLSKSINVAWDSTSNIEVKSIIVGDSPFRIVFQEVPFVLIGDPSGISNGKINYSVQIPNDLCTQDGQVNCVEQKQYDIPVEIQTVHNDTTLTKSSVIKINLASGSDIPLVFVLLAIGAVPVAFILRKVGSKKSKRKASGSSHKPSKNGSNTKKVTV